jgi:predicted PurR-regulated permease PerM
MKARRPPAPPAWVFVAAGLLLYAAFALHEVLIPFALSFALAYLLNPMLRFFEARGLRRDHIVVAVYLLIAASLTVAANSLLPAMSTQLALLQGKAPGYFAKLQVMLRGAQHNLALRLPFGQSVVDSWGLKLYDPLVEQLPKLPSYVLGLIPFFSLLFLVPFITFFLMLDSNTLLQKVIQVCPSRYVEQALHLLSEIDTSLGNYIRGLLITALAIAVASYAGLVAIKVDYALAIAALSGVASFIPYLGAVLGMAAGALVAFFQYHRFSAPMEVAVLFFGIRFADEAFLQPFISKYAVHLHPLVFLLALMTGCRLFGFVGLLFAVPAACVVKALLTVAWDWYASETRPTHAQGMPGLRVPYV